MCDLQVLLSAMLEATDARIPSSFVILPQEISREELDLSGAFVLLLYSRNMWPSSNPSGLLDHTRASEIQLADDSQGFELSGDAKRGKLWLDQVLSLPHGPSVCPRWDTDGGWDRLHTSSRIPSTLQRA